MRRVIVLNAKGGCGKTTVATNLASNFAVRGYRTALIDYDPQGSSMQWLRARPPACPAIQGVAMHDASRIPFAGAWQLRVPRDTERVVVDTPAGLRAMDLTGRVTGQDLLLIPIQPSAIDMRAAADFIRDLLLIGKLRPQDRRIGIVGNRTRRGSTALQALQGFLNHLQIPVLEHLREAQTYVQAAEQGVGVCELTSLQARFDQACWNTILAWAEAGAAPPRAAQASPPAPQVSNTRPVPAFLVRTAQSADESPRPAPQDLN